MKIDGSGQRKTQRGLCSRAHGKRDPFDTSYCVAKRSSDRSLTRRPYPQVLQCQPRVARLSGTGVKPVFGRCPGRSSARQPSPQVPLWHPGVAKRSSIDASAQRPYPQVLQCHLCVARPSSVDTLVTRPRPQVRQSRLPVAKQSSIGPFVHEMGPFCGRRGLDRVFLHEMGPFCGRRGPEWMLGRSFATATPPTGRPGASPRQRRRHDCVRCVGSGFDLALRDGVRIFE